MTAHLSIATDGLAPSIYSHSLFAKLGFGYSVEIIITPVVPTIGGGGGWGGSEHYDITFIITWNGRVIKKSYSNMVFDAVCNIFVSLKNVSIHIGGIKSRLISTLFRTQLNSVKNTEVNINVEEKPTHITVKRKLK